MPYANLILYKKGILNDADLVSRRPDFYPIANMCMSELNLLWDVNVPEIIYIGNDLALLALSTLGSLNVDDDFPSRLKGAYSIRL
jgi:hypothetical protein